MWQSQLGKQSVQFEHPPVIVGRASVVGEKEGQGPYGDFFTHVEKDPQFGGTSWEEAEGRLQGKTAEAALEDAGCTKEEIRYIVAGDLLGQLMASSFGLMSLERPIFGVYGACSTMGESISLASMLVSAGYGNRVMALTSSHFASAEKQFRFPLGYGSQRPKESTWTVTGSGAVVLAREDLFPKGRNRGRVYVRGITTGKIVDLGVKDSMNMGACMAPGAAEVIASHFRDFSSTPEEYDKIITGDLGIVGKDILLDLLRAKGFDIARVYMDCGIEIYGENQNTQAGGSGCGCSASMLTGYILKMMEEKKWNRVLFVPTGALLSVVSYNEGNSVPGIAHGILLETKSH